MSVIPRQTIQHGSEEQTDVYFMIGEECILLVVNAYHWPITGELIQVDTTAPYQVYLVVTKYISDNHTEVMCMLKEYDYGRDEVSK